MSGAKAQVTARTQGGGRARGAPPIYCKGCCFLQSGVTHSRSESRSVIDPIHAGSERASARESRSTEDTTTCTVQVSEGHLREGTDKLSRRHCDAEGLLIPPPSCRDVAAKSLASPGFCHAWQKRRSCKRAFLSERCSFLADEQRGRSPRKGTSLGSASLSY